MRSICGSENSCWMNSCIVRDLGPGRGHRKAPLKNAGVPAGKRNNLYFPPCVKTPHVFCSRPAIGLCYRISVSRPAGAVGRMNRTPKRHSSRDERMNNKLITAAVATALGSGSLIAHAGDWYITAGGGQAYHTLNSGQVNNDWATDL